MAVVRRQLIGPAVTHVLLIVLSIVMIFPFVTTLMLPEQVTLIPLFFIMKNFGWIDRYQGLIVPFVVTAFGVFLLRQFFLTIPRELEDAAIIDGCGPWGLYWRIILPLAVPGLA